MKYNSLYEKRPVRYGNLPVKLLRFKREANSRVFKLHWHDRLEIMMLDEGSLELQLTGQTIRAQAGDVVVINCSNTHTGIVGPDGVQYRTIMLELLEPFAYNENLRRMLLPYYNFGAAFLPKINDPELRTIIDALYEAVEQKTDGYELTVTGLCYALIGRLVGKYTDGDFVRLPDNSRMRDIIRFIEEHFREPLTTASVSKEFGYDKAYFCRRFKEATGLTPINYIRILRLENARRLLKEPDVTVAAAATANGFPDQNYFSRCFKSHYGLSPTEYIRSLQE